jgi:glutamate dehydrogenase (NAD(P)+)
MILIYPDEGDVMEAHVYLSFTQMVDWAAENLKLSRTEYEFAKYPERELAVSIPVEMDDGTVTIFQGVRAQHSSLFGPYTGGLRLHPRVDRAQIRGLAGLMTLKCALAGLPFGGACGGVAVDRRAVSKTELKRLVRRYTAMVLPIIGAGVDIHSHDVGTDAEIMGWMMDTYSMMAGTAVPGIVTGKPVALSGSLGRTSATGNGAGYVLSEAMKRARIPRDRCTAALAGFGKVGRAVARTLYADGVKIIAASDSTGGIVCDSGVDVEDLAAHKAAGGGCDSYDAPGLRHVPAEAVLTAPATILALCAADTQLDAEAAAVVQCDVLLEAGNAQLTLEADRALHTRGVFVIPDLMATLGGLVVSYFERVQNVQSLMWDEYEVNRMLKRIVLKTFDEVWEQSRLQGLTLREGCYAIALQRVCEAKRIRGIFP